MTLGTYLTRSGLVVAEESRDETQIQRALEQIDHPFARNLVLTREVDRHHGCFVWAVYVNWSDNKPAVYVCRWDDVDGRPLPLSSGLVGRVQAQLNRADQVGIESVDRANRERQERHNRERVETRTGIAHEFARSAKRHFVPHPSQALRVSRDRQRREGKRV